MAIRNKYGALTQWLQSCGQETVVLMFDELNGIITIPTYAYNDGASWANCTTRNSTPFQRGWLNAGYKAKVRLQEKCVVFSKGNFDIPPRGRSAATERKKQRGIPNTLEEELLLTVSDNLLGLTKDRYLLVELTRENSAIVEACLAADPAYSMSGKAVAEKYFGSGDYSERAYFEVIHCIATENSTRTSKETMEILARYCANPDNNFLSRVQSGDQTLVDALTLHLAQSKSRKDKSLASKMCRYLNEWLYGGCAYTINDSVVRAVLPYYLAYYKIDRSLWAGKKFDDLSYVAFYALFSLVRDAVGVLDNHQLDHLIWYAYKNDKIRTELAKALAEVLR